ncbi:MAG TPA: bifunctional glutamate N-acetyltransferase/amino-acid acetyltransferase ArgJ [Methylomirabilota bacterium]|nr:bifunctional glutamate N-acetyltransferase/amino-acid acetyltransferase ArgJ [Methylomirabilota bacterium]
MRPAGDVDWLDGGVTAVPGFLAGGVAAGIKPSGKKDLALIHSPSPARSAAVFTTNQVKGAPVLVSMEHARTGALQAIIASSGCSNVCTGERGLKDAREMVKQAAELLRIPPSHVLIAATGVIGQPLPMDKVRAAIPKLVKSLSPKGGREAAEAIMTTDTRLKEAALRCEVGGRTVTLGGVAKGVGMIEPHLATMFCFVTTDAAVARGALDPVLKRAVDASFNRITVDSDQSTSDTVAVIANGLAENAPLDKGARGMRDFALALDALVGRLARMLVQDGEGATKLVSVTVRGAASRRDALVAARSVANSPLVKTAINGADPNWGRIMMALGKAAARVEQDKVAIAFGGDDGQSERLVERGMLREGVRLDRVREIMGRQALDIIIDLGIGRAEERVWTCDLSEEYVRINGKYTT